MGIEWMKLQYVAGNYSITSGNFWGATSRITGSGSLEQAREHAINNARLNRVSAILVKVGRGDWKKEQVA